MKKRQRMKSYALTTLAALGTATIMMAQGHPLPYDPNIVMGRLDNGLTYIIRHNEYPKERADFYIAQKVGAVQEEDTQDGLAHFLEHMAFNGTKNFPGKDIITYMESVGVRFGNNINAYTSLDQTVYHLTNVPTVREGVVDSALMVLHDWSGFITLADEEIDKERGVIREEWRTSNTASRRMYFAHMRNLRKGTPYAVRDVIGDTAVINNFTYDELRAYYHKWYRPDLQGIIIVGDIDAKAMEQKIKDMWADIPAHENPAERVYCRLEPHAEPMVSVVTDKECTQNGIEINFNYDATPFEMRNTAEEFAMRLCESVALNCISLRFNELTNKSTSVAAGANAYRNLDTPLTFAISFAAMAKKDSLSKTIDFLLNETERIRRYGVTESELQMVKTNMLTNYENSFKSRAKEKNYHYTGEYQRVFLEGENTMGIEIEYPLAKSIIESITRENLNMMLAERLGKNVKIYLSAQSDDSQVPSEAELLSRYKASLTAELSAPEEKTVDKPLVDHTPTPGTIVSQKKDAVFGAEEWVLSNGTKIYLKPTKYSDNSIGINAQSHGGLSYEDLHMALVNNVLGYVLDQSGIGDHSQEELRRILAGKSASIGKGISQDYEQIWGSTTPRDFDVAMQLVYLSFKPMREDKNAFETIIDQVRTSLAYQEHNPLKAFSDTINLTYNNGDPSYQPLTKQNIGNIKHSEVMELYNNRFANAADFMFYITGDFEIDSVKQSILTWIGGIETNDKLEKDAPRVTWNMPTGIITKQFGYQMTTKKESIYMIYGGWDTYSQHVNRVYYTLGRLLSMRYLETIREDEGGSYGVSASAHVNERKPQNYILQISFDTDPDKADVLLPIIEREIKRIADEGPNLDDLRKIKEASLNSHADELETNGYWTSAVINKTMWDKDIVTGVSEDIQSISPEEISALARKILNDKNLMMVRMRPEEE